MAIADANDTIAALSSGRPPAAIAVIRLSGPRAEPAAEALAGPLPGARRAALREFRDPATGEVIDQGLLLRFPAPNSVTGEDVLEFQCHGGRAVVERLLDALLSQPGLRLAEPGEFTRRALAHGRIDLTEAEGLADLLMAETEMQRRAAQQRVDGSLRKQLEGWRLTLLDLAADAEVAIDYPDEEDGMVAPPLTERIAALAADVDALSKAPAIEPLRDGVRVVVAGPPNYGKSSLINAMSRQDRAIVTPIAGTTRDSIEVPLAIDGIPFLLVDTAGIRETDDPVEEIGIERANREIQRSDLLLWLGEPQEMPAQPHVVPIRTKCDLGGTDDGRLAVSAVTGEGLDELFALLRTRAASVLPSPTAIALTRRERELVLEMGDALRRARALPNPLLQAEEFRCARNALDKVTGRLAVDDLLDALFSRFCLGK